jgi:hypothetical protein
MNKVRRGLPRQLDHLHRTGAVAFGIGLGAFAVLGFVNRLDMFSTTGRPVLGLSSNGLLSTISVVVAAILAAGLRGGRTASTVLVVVGAAFVASGLVSTLVLGTPLNLLAFRIPNVVFSFGAGALLLFLGAWAGSPGGSPTTTPTTANGTRTTSVTHRCPPSSAIPTTSPRPVSSPRPSAPSPSTRRRPTWWPASTPCAACGSPRSGCSAGGRATPD